MMEQNSTTLVRRRINYCITKIEYRQATIIACDKLELSFGSWF